jgi:predicted NBD/HSP70 family sugar kinase
MKNASDIKAINILDIIKVVRNYGPLTKPDIAARLGLTGVSVHNFINELLAKNVIVEDGIAESNGGRRATLYNLNFEFGYIIGQGLDIDSISTYIFTLNLKILYHHVCNIPLQYNQMILDIMSSEIERGLEETGINSCNCFGIGVSVPGQVDYVHGVIKNIPHMQGWNGIPLKNYLEKKTGITTFVDNDTNNFALVSKWVNDIPFSSDSVALSISLGVGVGFLTKGEVFRGAHSNAGEIGHATIKYDGPKCSCGNRGCLDVLLSERTIIEKVKSCFNEEGNNFTINRIVEMAREGNEKAYAVLKETAFLISIAIDHLSKSYDPAYIVVYSNWLTEFADMTNFIIDDVFARTSWISRDDLQIKFSSIEENSGYCGAVLVLENIFSGKEENVFMKNKSCAFRAKL